MPRTIEASGRSIDEAIFKGLKELEISIDEVEIDIIQHESKGILGIGAKPAIVKLIEREPEDISLPEYLRPEYQERERRERRDRREPRQDNRDRRGRRDRGPREEREAAPQSDMRETQAEAAGTMEVIETEIIEKPAESRERRDRRGRSRRDRDNRPRYQAKEPPELHRGSGGGQSGGGFRERPAGAHARGRYSAGKRRRGWRPPVHR